VAFIENQREVKTKIWEIRRLPQYASKRLFTPKHVFEYEADGTTLAWEHMEDPENGEQVLLNGPQFLGKYTENTGGQMKESGWTKPGLKKWLAWKKMSEEARAIPENQEFERKFLKKLRDELGIMGTNPDEMKSLKRKADCQAARQAADQESDVEMDYD
jgi:hypothetical protein